jgi:gluconate 2-dehydrogenase gamma chain
LKETQSNRRRFITAALWAGGGSLLALNVPAVLAAGQAAALKLEEGAPLTNLSPAEARALGAVADQVIPPDDLPGATQAGVVYFIDNVLGGFMAGAAPLLKQGVADLDRAAIESCPGCRGFAYLPFDQQTVLLEAIEASPFFNTMITLTHCGLFAAPSWGGNRDKLGWALLGFEDRHAWQPPFGYYDAASEDSGHGS